jgi:hypothetical protein
VRLRSLLIAGWVGVVLCMTSALAADKPVAKAQRAAALQNLLDCRKILNDAERLVCFERQTALIDDAESKKEILVIDRTQAVKIREENFGLPSPQLPVAGLEENGSGGGVSDIRSIIREARLLKSGKWLLVLEDGARWFQTDSSVIRDPKPSQGIRIRKAALGSYFANINGQTAIRVRRINPALQK